MRIIQSQFMMPVISNWNTMAKKQAGINNKKKDHNIQWLNARRV